MRNQNFTRNDLKDIFLNTLEVCRNVNMETKVYLDTPIVPPVHKNISIKVINSDTLSCASPNCLILNFANGEIPGGKTLKGGTSQEENLCQRTSLYKSLTSKEAKDFYLFNREVPNFGFICSILTKGVLVVKDSEFKILNSPYCIDVLSIAAPKLVGPFPCKVEFLEELLFSKINQIISIAAEQKYKKVILGAWGCGTYKNIPEQISRIFHEVIYKYSGYFNEIIFAIPGHSKNYNVFYNEFLNNKFV